MKTLDIIKPSDTRYLVDSEFLKVIKIANKRGNLALSTCCQIDTNTNSVKLSYHVRAFNDKLKRINKRFDNYLEAFKYYQRVYERFAD